MTLHEWIWVGEILGFFLLIAASMWAVTRR